MKNLIPSKKDIIIPLIFFGFLAFWYIYIERDDAPYIQFSKSFAQSHEGIHDELGKEWDFGDFKNVKFINGDPVVTFDITGSTSAECMQIELQLAGDEYLVLGISVGTKKEGLAPQCLNGQLTKIDI